MDRGSCWKKLQRVLNQCNSCDSTPNNGRRLPAACSMKKKKDGGRSGEDLWAEVPKCSNSWPIGSRQAVSGCDYSGSVWREHMQQFFSAGQRFKKSNASSKDADGKGSKRKKTYSKASLELDGGVKSPPGIAYRSGEEHSSTPITVRTILSKPPGLGSDSESESEGKHGRFYSCGLSRCAAGSGVAGVARGKNLGGPLIFSSRLAKKKHCTRRNAAK